MTQNTQYKDFALIVFFSFVQADSNNFLKMLINTIRTLSHHQLSCIAFNMAEH